MSQQTDVKLHPWFSTSPDCYILKISRPRNPWTVFYKGSGSLNSRIKDPRSQEVYSLRLREALEDPLLPGLLLPDPHWSTFPDPKSRETSNKTSKETLLKHPGDCILDTFLDQKSKETPSHTVSIRSSKKSTFLDQDRMFFKSWMKTRRSVTKNQAYVSRL